MAREVVQSLAPVVRQRWHDRNLRLGQFEGEGVLLENGTRNPPSSRPTW